MSEAETELAAPDAELFDYPGARDRTCPFAPCGRAARPERRGARVPGPDLGRQHPVAGDRARRAARDPVRSAGEQRRQAARVPVPERGDGGERSPPPADHLQRRRRRPHADPPHDDGSIHAQPDGEAAAGDPAVHRRADRQDARGPEPGGPEHRTVAAAALADDLRAARSAVRGPRVLPGARLAGDPQRQDRRAGPGGEPGARRLPGRTAPETDGGAGRRRHLGLRRADQGGRGHPARGRHAVHDPADHAATRPVPA